MLTLIWGREVSLICYRLLTASIWFGIASQRSSSPSTDCVVVGSELVRIIFISDQTKTNSSTGLSLFSPYPTATVVSRPAQMSQNKGGGKQIQVWFRWTKLCSCYNTLRGRRLWSFIHSNSLFVASRLERSELGVRYRTVSGHSVACTKTLSPLHHSPASLLNITQYWHGDRDVPEEGRGQYPAHFLSLPVRNKGLVSSLNLATSSLLSVLGTQTSGSRVKGHCSLENKSGRDCLGHSWWVCNLCKTAVVTNQFKFDISHQSHVIYL